MNIKSFKNFFYKNNNIQNKTSSNIYNNLKQCLSPVQHQNCEFPLINTNSLDKNQEVIVGQEAIKIFMHWYLTCSVVSSSVNRISSKISSFNFVVQEIPSNKIIADSEEIDLIRNYPNPYETTKQFIEGMVNDYIVTGNYFAHIINTGKFITEIHRLRPDYVSIQADDKGYPKTYSYDKNNQYNFERQKLGSYYKFIAGDKSQLSHLKRHNMLHGDGHLYGLSLLNSLQNKIILEKEIEVYNLNLLKQGQTSRGIFNLKDENVVLSPEQIETFAKSIKDCAGSSGAGKSVVIAAPGLEYIKTSETIKDMDYGKLHNLVEKAIYNGLGIPLPLVNSESMTYANYTEAKLIFLDNTVLLIADSICEFLTRILITEPNKRKIVVDKASIEELRERALKNAEIQLRNGMISINESRRDIGRESVEGLDSYFQLQNMVPVASDNYTDDNRQAPKKDI